MKKKSLFLFSLLCFTAATFAQEFETGGINYRITDDPEQVEVIAKTSLYEGKVTIPASVTYDSKTYSVTAIGRRAFEKCSGLTSITIPNSVKTIKFFAFNSCSQLSSVAIPNGVVTIEEAAFGYCSKLSSITFGNSVKTIEGGAFTNCRSLVSITIPNSVTSISQGLFTNCDNLTSVTIGNNVKIIDKQAFSDCKGLTSITIPSSVTNIKERAFENCSGLTTVTCLNPTPPALEPRVFTDVNTSSCTLKVPQGYETDYQTADQWRAFGTIAGVTTSQPTTAVGSTKVYTLSGALYVTGSTQRYTVHSLTGEQVYVGSAPSLPLPRGMYVVTIGKDRHKVVVR